MILANGPWAMTVQVWTERARVDGLDTIEQDNRIPINVRDRGILVSRTRSLGAVWSEAVEDRLQCCPVVCRHDLLP